LGASYRYEAGMLFMQHNPGSTILSLIISDTGLLTVVMKWNMI